MRVRQIQHAVLTVALSAALGSSASAQSPLSQKAPAIELAQKSATAPRPPVPPAERLVLLIRMSLLTLNDALQTGNYTVLRDRGSPAFRAANSASKLARAFSRLESQGIDLGMVAIGTPQLSEAVVDSAQRLHIKGFFPGQPTRLDFDLLYEPVAGHWQLFAISVGESPVPPQTPANTNAGTVPPVPPPGPKPKSKSGD